MLIPIGYEIKLKGSIGTMIKLNRIEIVKPLKYASAIGTTWGTWYEARFSYAMEHPYYLELNGVSV